MSPIAVIGPTGIGKSALALDLAEKFNAEIVNCDAMQQYRGMDIGTAKTPVEERRGIPHHQIDVLDVTETATVARYQKAATADIEELLEKGKVPIIVGGSMLYIQSLLDEWQFPPTDKAVRAKWETELAKRGVASLHNELAQKDPVAAETILPTDPRRTVRALEVIELTGKPYAASKPQHNPIPKWGTKIIGLKASTEWLDPRLLKRTQKMFEEGLIEETKLLCSNGLKEGVTASRAIGYQQAIAVIDGEISIEQAIEDTFIATRQYVRRQRSWFKRDDRIDWFIASTSSFPDEVLQALAEH
ncbi:MAG: tRNA (adenosine(37)-N6)-dimethylallyltransferase MiaA [Lawsonella sp.]